MKKALLLTTTIVLSSTFCFAAASSQAATSSGTSSIIQATTSIERPQEEQTLQGLKEKIDESSKVIQQMLDRYHRAREALDAAALIPVEESFEDKKERLRLEMLHEKLKNRINAKMKDCNDIIYLYNARLAAEAAASQPGTSSGTIMGTSLIEDIKSGKFVKEIDGYETKEAPLCSHLSGSEKEQNALRAYYFANAETFEKGVSSQWGAWVNIVHPTILSGSGWKFHVAADLEKSDAIGKIVVPYLLHNNIASKIAPNKKFLSKLSGTQTGKFITIYPDNYAHAKKISNELNELLKAYGFGKENPPTTLPTGDAMLGDSKYLYVRYGVICNQHDITELDKFGERQERKTADSRHIPFPEFIWGLAPEALTGDSSPFSDIGMHWLIPGTTKDATLQKSADVNSWLDIFLNVTTEEIHNFSDYFRAFHEITKRIISKESSSGELIEKAKNTRQILARRYPDQITLEINKILKGQEIGFFQNEQSRQNYLDKYRRTKLSEYIVD